MIFENPQYEKTYFNLPMRKEKVDFGQRNENQVDTEAT